MLSDPLTRAHSEHKEPGERRPQNQAENKTKKALTTAKKRQGQQPTASSRFTQELELIEDERGIADESIVDMKKVKASLEQYQAHLQPRDSS
jgi:hypothetical protein